MWPITKHAQWAKHDSNEERITTLWVGQWSQIWGLGSLFPVAWPHHLRSSLLDSDHGLGSGSWCAISTDQAHRVRKAPARWRRWPGVKKVIWRWLSALWLWGNVQPFFLLVSIALHFPPGSLRGARKMPQLGACWKLTSGGAGGTQDLTDLGVNRSKPSKG